MFMKLAKETGTPGPQIMAIAGFTGMAALFLLTALRGGIHHLRPKKPRVLVALGLMFLLNYMVWLIALARLPLANFYTVIFLAPTVGAIFAAIFLREALNLQKILAIIAGFVGVVIAVNPTQLFHDKSYWLGYAATLFGMFVIVTQMLTMRYAGNHESRESIAFYPRIAAVLGGVVGMILWGVEPMTMKGLLYSILTGSLGGFGWMCMAQAYKLAPAATIAPFHYSQIISGAFFGYLIWHDIPSFHLLCGALIIIGSGLYIVTHARKAGQLAKTLVETP